MHDFNSPFHHHDYPDHFHLNSVHDPILTYHCGLPLLRPDNDHELDEEPLSLMPTTSSPLTAGRVSYDAFVDSKSRVVRLFNLPPNPASHLAALFSPSHHLSHSLNPIPIPLTLWCLREECGGHPNGEEESVWAVFKSHEEARTSLHLSRSAHISVATALEGDLLPYAKLRRFELQPHFQSLPQPQHSISSRLVSPTSRLSPAPPPSMLSPLSNPNPSDPRMNMGHSTLHHHQQSQHPPPRRPQARQFFPGAYSSVSSPLGAGHPLSSNPPDKSPLRAGDWVCGEGEKSGGLVEGCGAHNFGRNERCIGCSALRPAIPGMVPYSQASPTIANPVMPVAIQNHPISALSPTSPLSVNGAAPRFRSHPSISPMSPSNAQSTGPYHQPNAPYPHHLGSHQPQFATPINPPAPSTAQPPYLPASEYLKLLTPSGHALAIGGRVRNISSNPMTPCVIWWPDNERLPDPGCVRPLICGSQPPIMNTGNRGPIEHQPGDWICGRCHYLNWRRRKVCATCYPYAEGNLDGVSPSVLAERVALLRGVLERELQVQRLKNMQQMRDRELHLAGVSSDGWIRNVPISGSSGVLVGGGSPVTTNGSSGRSSLEESRDDDGWLNASPSTASSTGFPSQHVVNGTGDKVSTGSPLDSYAPFSHALGLGLDTGRDSPPTSGSAATSTSASNKSRPSTSGGLGGYGSGSVGVIGSGKNPSPPPGSNTKVLGHRGLELNGMGLVGRPPALRSLSSTTATPISPSALEPLSMAPTRQLSRPHRQAQGQCSPTTTDSGFWTHPSSCSSSDHDNNKDRELQDKVNGRVDLMGGLDLQGPLLPSFLREYEDDSILEAKSNQHPVDFTFGFRTSPLTSSPKSRSPRSSNTSSPIGGNRAVGETWQPVPYAGSQVRASTLPAKSSGTPIGLEGDLASLTIRGPAMVA